MKIDGKSMITHRSIICFNFIKYISHEFIILIIPDISLLSEFKCGMTQVLPEWYITKI